MRTRKSVLHKLAPATALAAMLVLASAFAQEPPPAAGSGADAARAEAVGTDIAGQQASRTLRFKDLGLIYPMKLRTVFGQASIPLNLRADQIVTAATLQLRYAHSPSLRFDLSHLSVYVNDELLKTMPLSADTASGNSVRLPIDPRLLLPHNQIRFELVAHYAKPNECEDPAHTSLWADISNDSRLELSFAPLNNVPALEHLPAPMFDAGDERRLRLPFSFAGKPDTQTLKAAGIVANWFGAQADYRGADFPVSFDELPRGTGVVFVSGRAPWTGFERFASRSTPTIAVVDNPASPGSQLLVFSAPDAEGLITAAQALALGKLVLQGAEVEVLGLQLPEPRPAWSSSRWIDPSRPLPLADRAVAGLSVTGLVPGPIGFEFSLPPDLYPLSQDSIKARLQYRAAPNAAVNSQLNVLLNGQFAGGTVLNRGKVRVDDSTPLDLVLPVQALHAHNRLDAQYHFRRDTDKACEDFDITGLQGSIDPASTLEVRNFAYFVEMPALEKLADGAFPFSRHSDLATTAVVLPSQPSESEVSAALIVLGHVGRWTLDAASRLEVTTVDGLEAVKDRELLLVGRLDNLNLPADWVERMPLRLNDGHVELAPIGQLEALNERWLRDRDVSAARAVASRVLVNAGQRFSVLMGFESPLQGGRNVVLLTAGRGGDVRDAALTLTDPGDSQFVRGALTLVTGSTVTGYDLSARYEVGHLPWWFAIKRWLSLHPYLLWPLAVLFVILVGILLQSVLRARAARRLANKP